MIRISRLKDPWSDFPDQNDLRSDFPDKDDLQSDFPDQDDFWSDGTQTMVQTTVRSIYSGFLEGFFKPEVLFKQDAFWIESKSE